MLASVTSPISNFDIKGAKLGVRVGELQGELQGYLWGMSNIVKNTPQTDRCWHNESPNGPYGNPLFQQSCLFVLFGGASGPKVSYSILLRNMYLGTFDFAENAVHLVTQKYGPPTARINNQGYGVPIESVDLAWQIPLNTFSGMSRIGVGGLISHAYPENYAINPTLMPVISSQQILIGKVKTNSNSKAWAVDLALVDLKVGREHFAELTGQANRAKADAMQQERQKAHRPNF
jgi:hypothetical protein